MGLSLIDRMNQRLTNWLSADLQSPGFPKCDFEKIQYEIRPCDVLLIEGRSRVSEVIKNITLSPWSHAALYIGRLHDIENPILRKQVAKNFNGKYDSQMIIESVMGKGTVISPLSIYDKDHIRICRPSGISRQDSQRVIAYTIGALGKEYDIRQIIDLARFMFPWSILPGRWRSSLFQYRASVSTRKICSSLIAEAFASVKFPVLPAVKRETADHKIELVPRNPRLFTPSDFDYSPYFEIIKYPFFSVDSAPYRDLPWTEKEIYSNSEDEMIPKEQIHGTQEENNGNNADKGSNDDTPSIEIPPKNNNGDAHYTGHSG